MSQTNLYSKNVPRVELCADLRLGRGPRLLFPVERLSHLPRMRIRKRPSRARFKLTPCGCRQRAERISAPRSIAWI
jgi:hypothetical protein